MAPQNAGLGERIPLLKPSELTASQRTLYDTLASHAVPEAKAAGFAAQTDDGSFIGPFNVALQSPEIGSAFGALQGAEAKNTTINARTRQVVILTVGSVWKSEYELYAHKAEARKAGISESAIAALVAGETSEELSDEEKTAQAFTAEITRNHQVTDEMFERVRATFRVQGIVDLLFLAGCYDIVCSLLNTFQVPVP